MIGRKLKDIRKGYHTVERSISWCLESTLRLNDNNLKVEINQQIKAHAPG